MENYIDLINAYLDKTLSKAEVLSFENRLKTDSEFNTIYEEHLLVIKGIERVKLKTEINRAKRKYIQDKWLKYSIGIFTLLLIALTIWPLFSNNDNKAKNELREVLNFETELIQNYEVSTDSIVYIKGEKGTQIIINPKDLEFESGQVLNSKNIKVELIELTNNQELLLSNAQTLSNGKWLISGGAFKIDINVDDEPAVLKEGKTLSVKFPKNTQEKNMQIFYGNRNENGYLNWNLSDVKLKNEKYFTMFFKDTIMLDIERTSMYGGVETFKNQIMIDTLGYLSKNNLKDKFPEIKDFNSQADTIIVYQEYIYSETIDSYAELSVVNISDYKTLINQKNLTNNDLSQLNRNYEKKNLFYESVQISKLGWINIDKYSNIENKVTINLKNNLDIDFNTYADQAYRGDSTWHETYLIDKENNTILNIYSSVIEIPKGKPFTIISCSVVEDTFYVCRKSIKELENTVISLDYKKRNKEQIKSLLRL